MTQLVLNISDPSVLPTLKKVVKAFNGVTIARPSNRSRKIRAKNELELAIEEERNGEVTHWESAEALIKHISGIGHEL